MYKLSDITIESSNPNENLLLQQQIADSLNKNLLDNLLNQQSSEVDILHTKIFNNYLYKYFDKIVEYEYGERQMELTFATEVYFHRLTNQFANLDIHFYNNEFDENLLKHLKEIGFNMIEHNISHITFENTIIHINEHNKVIIIYFMQSIDNYTIKGLKIYHNINEISEYANFVSKLKEFVLPIKPNKSYISLLTQNVKGFDTIQLELKNPTLNVAQNYGAKFLPIYEKIETSLKNDDTKHGKLIIFSGIAGSGKSYLIKHLVSKIERKVIFIPPNLVHSICNPSFTEFLIQNSNSVLVLEDAESILSDRVTNPQSADAVSNLLNLTDGTYGDLLNITIIATFNMDYEKVDSALRRKGRLQAEYRFEKLTIDESNNLLQTLNKNFVTDVPMSLTDIYNYEYVQPLNESNKKQIGFN